MTDLLARDAAVFLHQSSSSPVAWPLAGAEGIWLTAPDGRRWMDFHGNTAHHLGFGHPRVKAAIAAQLDALPFSPRRYTNDPAVTLAERLAALAPTAQTRVLFAPSGSDAVEIALRLARAVTGRAGTLGFEGAYHGTTFAAASAGGDPTFRGLGPMREGARHVAQFAPLEEVAAVLERRETGAFLAEPMRATPRIAPEGYWQAVRALCDRTGTLLIFDEIPTGLGKTGRVFASEHEGVVADITLLGKALGGGILPLAAVLADARLNVAAAHDLGHFTHEKNPVLAAAGLATLDVLEENALPARAARLGAQAVAQLTADLAGGPGVVDIRGRGMLFGVELDDPARARAICAACMARGLAFKTSGGILTLSPPLVMEEGDLMAALAIVVEEVRRQAAG